MQKRWFWLSVVLHALVIALCYLGLPHFLQKPIELPQQIIPVDVVDIGDITNTRLANQPQVQPKPAPPKPQLPKPLPAPPPPEQKPQPKAEPPQPKPEPPKENAEALPDLLKKLQPKPQPKKEEPKEDPQQQMMASLLKNVAKLKPDDAPPDDKPVKKQTDATPPQTSPSPVLSDHLTISETDALRRQIAGCWNVPIGARDAQNMSVEIHIEVNPDRTVRSAEIVDKMRVQTDSFFRAMAESALRALYNPHCSPLLLPPDRYNDWHSITFNFDPHDMLF